MAAHAQAKASLSSGALCSRRGVRGRSCCCQSVCAAPIREPGMADGQDCIYDSTSPLAINPADPTQFSKGIRVRLRSLLIFLLAGACVRGAFAVSPGCRPANLLQTVIPSAAWRQPAGRGAVAAACGGSAADPCQRCVGQQAWRQQRHAQSSGREGERCARDSGGVDYTATEPHRRRQGAAPSRLYAADGAARRSY
jgi:hypothetical protein